MTAGGPDTNPLVFVGSTNPSITTNPLDPDTDDDGMTDGWEMSNGLDPTGDLGIDGRDGDHDIDGWTNYEEFLYGTDPA